MDMGSNLKIVSRKSKNLIIEMIKIVSRKSKNLIISSKIILKGLKFDTFRLSRYKFIQMNRDQPNFLQLSPKFSIII